MTQLASLYSMWKAWSYLISSFLFFSLSFTITVGWQLGVELPPFGLCFLQVLLIYLSPMIVAVSYTYFVIVCWTKVPVARNSSSRTRSRILVSTSRVIAVLPWLGLTGLFLTVFLIVDDPSMVAPTDGRFYCHLTSSIPALINVGAIILCCLIGIPLMFSMAYTLYKNRGENKHSGAILSLYIRLSLFSLLVVAGLSLVISTIDTMGENLRSLSFNFILVLIPVVGGVVFGTKKDLLGAWLFWRNRERLVSPPLTLVTETIAVEDIA
ncbi:hypothetical protein E4T56_gene13058 [Termitomyces sp. T112]|nr:hypothetical protein E4T56_gene13058 [Termitomyces sp. T112]